MSVDLLDLAEHALMFTAFVFVMMLVIEYVNVRTRGAWQSRLAARPRGQYLAAAALGVTPGCLGAFAVVALYSHRIVTLGAVVAAMIATSGDESFVMLAMIPKQALLLSGVLLALGIAAGALTDLIAGKRTTSKAPCEQGFDLHEEEPWERLRTDALVRQWRGCSATRGLLAAGLTVFLLALLAGQIGPPTWNWVRITLTIVSAAALFIVSTVPDHFLEEHLWRHVARQHVPRVFLWTLGALLAMRFVVGNASFEATVREGKWLVLLVACLVGLVPESGPHLAFVTLYAHGTIPFSILLASSVVQDGHGMLPLLAHSRRAFLGIKAINFAVGLVVGAVGLVLGL